MFALEDIFALKKACHGLQKLARDKAEALAAASAAAAANTKLNETGGRQELPPTLFVLPADLVMPPPAGFEQAPKAVQAMWCYARDVDEFREQAGAVIEAYNKATAAGALQSTAERAAAAVAYKIDAGYRNFVKDDKKWKQKRRVAAAKLEALATKARRLVKKARKLVSCGTVCEHMLPKRAMDFADVIRYEVRHVRMISCIENSLFLY